jgi:hypothetical protein
MKAFSLFVIACVVPRCASLVPTPSPSMPTTPVPSCFLPDHRCTTVPTDTPVPAPSAGKKEIDDE